MPDPAISPTTLGAVVYTVTNSKSAIADLSLSFPGVGTSRDFEIHYPPGPSGVQVTLTRGAETLNLLPGPIVNNTAAFAGRRIDASAALSGMDMALTCTITTTIGAAGAEPWSVRMSAASPISWQILQGDNDPMALTITRVMCDPVAAFTIAPGTTVAEKLPVTLTASLATGPALAPTVVGGPAPAVHYNWTHSGTIAVTAFDECGNQVKSFFAPGVYGPKGMGIGLQVWFDGACPSPVGLLQNSAISQTLTIVPRTQHLALVLDRSGSMTGSRWENAKTSARIITNLFAGLRSGVSASDRIEEIVFEDTSCTWHALPIDPAIAPKVSLSDVATADAAICAVDFGPAGSCTPIGDALIKAMDDLGTLGVADDPRFTIILLTDGYENSGTVRVDPINTPAPVPPVVNFAAARTTGLTRQAVNSRLSLFAVGLGSTVQEDVLDALPLPTGAGPAGIYRHVTDVGGLTEAIAQMVSLSQEALPVPPLPGSPPVADPTPLTHQRYFQLPSKVNRLAVAVEWTNPSDVIELSMRGQGSPVDFTPVPASLRQCPTHGFVVVDVASLFGGEDLVPGTEWRVVHKSGGVPQVIGDADLLIFDDLHVRMDVSFDRPSYRTGDPMVVTARIRAGDRPVTKANVTVELARPGESLGTFLAVNGRGYKPGPPIGPDPAHPKQAMLQTLCRQHDMSGLPILKPAGIFEDGTNQLHDDGVHHDDDVDDGNYANRYVLVDKEGTYTWRVFAEGALPDGSSFNRLMTVSKWVGINVDPANSVVVTSPVIAPRGIRAVRISVLLRDAKGEFLGPFRPADVRFKSSGGQFRKEKPDQAPDGVVYPTPDGGTITSHYDGRYSRVLECKEGESTKVLVIVQGKPMQPIVIGGTTASSAAPTKNLPALGVPSTDLGDAVIHETRDLQE